MKVKFNIPTKWPEVSSEQLMQYARLSLMELEGDTRLALLAINWAGYKIKLDEKSYRHEDIVVIGKNKTFRLQHFQVLELIESVRWTADNIEGVKAPALRFKTPNSQIYGTTLQQFLIADSAYLAYSATKDIKMLRILAAVYYGKFHPKTVKAKAATMKLRDYQLIAVYLWFTSVKKLMLEKYPYLYPDSGGKQLGHVNMKEVALDMLAMLNNGNIAENERIMKQGEIHAAFKKMNTDAHQAEIMKRNGRSN